MSYNTYEKYKDSGIEWIGEIPEHWEVKRLKRLAKICNGQDHKDVWDENGTYPIYGSGGIFGRSNTYLYNKPSVLLGRKGTIDKPQFVTNPFWTVDTAYYTNIYQNIVPKLFFYLCKTINFAQYQYGSAVPSMTQEVLNQIPFTLPPSLSEQTRITNFLDQKTAEIDELIADKQRLLALYEEEKTAIINQAVTKGINPDAPMKDSGIEWLGEIPAHWEVKKLKYIGKFTNGYAFKSVDFLSSGVKVMKISNIQNMNIDWNDESFVDENFYQNLSEYRVLKGDLVFALTRPIISSGIKVALLQTEEKILLNQRNCLFRTFSIDINWIYFILLSRNFISEFESRIDATGQQPNISSTDIGNIDIPIPDSTEISSIILNITRIIKSINSKITQTQKLIDLLTEYKTALISEVVTGKIKVSN